MTGWEIKVLPKTRLWQAHLTHSSTAARLLETGGVTSERSEMRVANMVATAMTGTIAYVQLPDLSETNGGNVSVPDEAHMTQRSWLN